MALNKQLVRHLSILQRLDTIVGVTIQELMELTQKDRRTIERDLQELKAAGFPLVAKEVHGRNRWKFMEGFKEKLEVPFSISELLSLYLARNVLKDLQGTPFYQDLEQICGKIQMVLNENGIRYLDHIQSVFYSPNADSTVSDKSNEIIKILIQALLRRQTLKIYYSKGNGKEKWFTIDPYLLSPYGGLYLEAWVHTEKTITTFMVNRIKEIEVTKLRYLPPDKNMLQDRLFHSFGFVREKPFDVKIRFDKSFASKLREWPIHPTQKLSKLKNKDILLTMQSGGWNEIISWVLAFGDKADVISPGK